MKLSVSRAYANWDAEGHGWFRRSYIRIVGWMFLGGWLRMRWMAHLLPKKISPQYILDAGCGFGVFSLALGQAFPKAEIDAVDLAEGEFFEGQLAKTDEMLSKLGSDNITVSKLNLFHLNAKDRYDLIVSVDVLEHIPGHREILSKFASALKPGGIFYIHMPRKGPAAKSSYFPEHVLEDLQKEHTGEMYDVEELVAELEHSGFSDIEGFQTFRWLGQTAWEWDRIIYAKSRRAYPLLFPLLKTMAYLDIWIPVGRSYGVAAVAGKRA